MQGKSKALWMRLKNVCPAIVLLTKLPSFYAKNLVFLSRYRFAAVPTHFRKTEDPRLQPRASQKLFHNTILLSKDCLKFQSTLNAWLGNEHQEWHLLYRASRDGFSAAAFHEKCDGHSPTLTIVLVSNKQ